MIIPGVHPFGPGGPFGWAYSIRPYTGYVLGAGIRENSLPRVGAYRIRPPGATIGGEYTSPGMIVRPLSGPSGGRMRYAPTLTDEGAGIRENSLPRQGPSADARPYTGYVQGPAQTPQQLNN